MKENIEAYFQVGTILWMSYPPAMYGQSFGSYEDSLLKVLRDDFFSCIELTQIKDDKLRERVKHLLSQSHEGLLRRAAQAAFHRLKPQ